MVSVSKMDLIEFAISIPKVEFFKSNERGELKVVLFNKALEESIDKARLEHNNIIVNAIANSLDKDGAETGRIVKLSYLNDCGEEQLLKYMFYIR